MDRVRHLPIRRDYIRVGRRTVRPFRLGGPAVRRWLRGTAARRLSFHPLGRASLSAGRFFRSRRAQLPKSGSLPLDLESDRRSPVSDTPTVVAGLLLFAKGVAHLGRASPNQFSEGFSM